MLRLATDTGGTFTDLVVEDGDEIHLFKSPTTPADPAQGVLDVIALAADHYGQSLADFLARADIFMHGTTRSINAILTGGTAKTAFLTSEGHPDVLTIREGGRIEPFNFSVGSPEPYIPRRLTFGIPGRMDSAGAERTPLDEQAVIDVAAKLRELEVEAVAVCLLWSVANGAHEARVGELLEKHLPGVPVTLSHKLNPTLREYRRASSAAIDASLKPLMFEYLDNLQTRLRRAGFNGRTLMVTSGGGVMDAEAVARAPIHSIGSGPAMAPVAGRYYVEREFDGLPAIVADTGGTTFDVSLVRDGRIPWTRETWIGQRMRGHMTGFPSVDVKSIGAGGGSIAWVDDGLLRVGPMSAGSTPGPVAYGRGGTKPTVTDCCIILGYIDPDFFLGGAMKLDRKAAVAALKEHVADKLELSVEEAAAAVLALSTEKMVAAIDEITVNQGIDPTQAVLIGGGGAAGLNAVAVGKRLGCAGILVPEAGAVLSAAGALMSDLSADFGQVHYTTTADFDYEGVAGVLADLRGKCENFATTSGKGALATSIAFFVEARYAHQIWEIEVQLPSATIGDKAALDAVREAFHATHEMIFEIADHHSEIEFVSWRAKVDCQLRKPGSTRLGETKAAVNPSTRRDIYFSGSGWSNAEIIHFEGMTPDLPIAGPAIVESSFTTVVVDPGATASRTKGGALRITIDA